VNCDATTSRCEHVRVKKVSKQGNTIDLYNLNLLERLMLRPREVISGGGAWGASSPSTLFAPTMHSSTRFLLGRRLFEAILCPFWDRCATFLVSVA
jgi:hypothetical protein